VRGAHGPHLTETRLTGKPDAGNPPVRFGGRGEVNPSSLPLSLGARRRSPRAMAWRFAEANEESAKWVLAHGHYSRRHCPPSLRSPACGTGALQKQTKCQQSGGTGRHLGGTWVPTGRTGSQFRPRCAAQMPPCTALYRAVPLFFRKFYRVWCLHTAIKGNFYRKEAHI
ncbi:MAG: hypothetical protein JWR26_4696, partial [Pedosphaera sp.]|nr:hypothetical protein [Pedosphaera sp.]